MIRQETILEIMSFWEGGVTAARLAEVLGISREHLQRNLLRSYRERFPSALKSRKGLSFVEDAAALRYAPASPTALMAFLRGLAVAAEAGGDAFPLRLSVERMPEPFMNGDDAGDKFREVTAAIVGRHALQIDYIAKSGPMQAWFSPHAIADVRPRPHARGYVKFEDGKGSYLDLIPSRIAVIHGSNASKYIGADQDTDWHERVDVEFEVDPTLDAGTRAAFIEEAGGHDRILYRGVRRALADYVERDLGLRRLGGNLSPAWCRTPQKDYRS
jgi:hypothetical protein